VVLQQMCQCLRIRHIIDCDKLDPWIAECSPHHVPSDPSKAINANPNGHAIAPIQILRTQRPSPGCASLTALCHRERPVNISASPNPCQRFSLALKPGQRYNPSAQTQNGSGFQGFLPT